MAQIISGHISILSLSKLWGVSQNSIYKWVHKCSPDHTKGTTVDLQKETAAAKLMELHHRIAELERAVGHKQMVVDYRAKLMEIASKELDVDLNRNGEPQKFQPWTSEHFCRNLPSSAHSMGSL